MSVFEYVVLSLAVYRLTLLFSKDVGPFRVFIWLRKSAIGELVSCPWCVSVWLSLIVNLAYDFNCNRSPLVVFACQVLSMSAIAIILDRCFSADREAAR